jgi:hypothetical protein
MNLIVYTLSVHPDPKFSKTSYTGCREATFLRPPTAKKAISVFRKISKQMDESRKRYGDVGPSKMDKKFDAAVEKILATEKIPVIPAGSDTIRVSSYFPNGHMSIEVIEVWK